MGLKLVMAVSADGFLARGPDDDMSWTGRADKVFFRVLTGVGGIVGVGSKTWGLMPMLRGREEVVLTRSPGIRSFMRPGPEGFVECPQMTLGRFAYVHPNAWLAGGPTVAYEAMGIGLVDEAHIVVAPAKLGAGISAGYLLETLQSRFQLKQATMIEHATLNQWRRRGDGRG